MPGSRKFTTNLHEISHWICVKTSGSCLENSSDFKHCFGLEVGATVEPGHRVQKYSSSDTLSVTWLTSSQVIHNNIVQTFPKHLMIVHINPKRFSKEGFSILVHEFFVLAQSIFFGIFTHGHGFQNTRCPAVGNSHCTFTKIFLGICWVYSICM